MNQKGQWQGGKRIKNMEVTKDEFAHTMVMPIIIFALQMYFTFDSCNPFLLSLLLLLSPKQSAILPQFSL
jgi:hypothetical protein